MFSNLSYPDLNLINDIYIDTPEGGRISPQLNFNIEESDFENNKANFTISGLSANSNFNYIDVDYNNNKQFDSETQSIKINNSKAKNVDYNTNFITPVLYYYEIIQEEDNFNYDDYVLFQFKDNGSFATIQTLAENLKIKVGDNEYFGSSSGIEITNVDKKNNSFRFYFSEEMINEISANNNSFDLYVPVDQYVDTNNSVNTAYEYDYLTTIYINNSSTHINDFIKFDYDYEKQAAKLTVNETLGYRVFPGDFYINYCQLVEGVNYSDNNKSIEDSKRLNFNEETLKTSFDVRYSQGDNTMNNFNIVEY